MHSVYFEHAKSGKKTPVFFRKIHRSIGQVTKKDGILNWNSVSGEMTLSKVKLNTPLQVGNQRFASCCEICTKRTICFNERYKGMLPGSYRIKKKGPSCLMWMCSNVCSKCTQYGHCYKMHKHTCQKMSGRNMDWGFILDRTVLYPRVANGDLLTLEDMAMKIMRPFREVTWLMYRVGKKDQNLYHSWEVAKRNGKVRRLTSPCPELKRLQKAVLEQILYDVPAHPCAMGFVPHRSIIDNAKVHINDEIVISMDMKDFFPSIGIPRVFGVLKAIGLPPKAAGAITALCTWKNQLPQGAPTSPALSNIVAYRLDQKLSTFFKNQGWDYTRYADDITFSRMEQPSKSVNWIISIVRKIVEEEGFKINEEKTKVMRKGRRQWVTGLVVNEKPNVVRWKYKIIRAAVHNASLVGIENAASKAGMSSEDFRHWLSGNVAFLDMVNPDVARPIRVKWEAVINA